MSTKVVRPTDPIALALIQQKRQTGVMLADLILTGIEGLIEDARAGDAGARALCRRMAEAGTAIRGIAVVRLPGEIES
jgi:hypothetical protein